MPKTTAHMQTSLSDWKAKSMFIGQKDQEKIKDITLTTKKPTLISLSSLSFKMELFQEDTTLFPSHFFFHNKWLVAFFNPLNAISDILYPDIWLLPMVKMTIKCFLLSLIFFNLLEGNSPLQTIKKLILQSAAAVVKVTVKSKLA